MRTLADLRILVVEDQQDILELSRIVLCSQGATVTLATSAAAALPAYQAGCFDLLLSDIHMPDISGFDLLKLMRQIEAACGWPPLHALAMTADPEAVRPALAAGYAEVLLKPFLREDLITLVARAGASLKSLRP